MLSLSLRSKFQNVENKEQVNTINNTVFGEKVGLVAKLFGCWHENISRPFVEGNTAYRACLNCGARKPFNPETLQSFGKFYYPPIIKKIEGI
jgi:hypothetical protein